MPANTPPIEELERALSDEKLSGFGRRAEKLLWEHRHELLSLAKLALLVREGGEEVAALNLPEMPPTIDRRPMYDDEPDGYLESDQDWSRDNDEAVRWLADNHRAIRAVLRTLEGLVK